MTHRRLLSWVIVVLTLLGLAQAAPMYTAQGYLDYVIGGGGLRRVNSGNTAICSGTSQRNYWQPNVDFTLSVPVGSSVVKAYLFWTGSSDTPDQNATLSLNGGASLNIAADGVQTGTVLGYRYFEAQADVINAVAAALPGGGLLPVQVSDLAFKAANPDQWRGACGAAGAVTLVIVHTTDFTDAAVSPRALVIDDVTLMLHPSVQGGSASYSGSITGMSEAADTPDARMTLATVEGDTSLNTGESMTFNGTETTVTFAEGEADRAALNGDGNSWEVDRISPTIAPGATSATYGISTNAGSPSDLILPVVMGLSWNVASDYGDAPASYGVARHTPPVLGDTATRLGRGIDFEGSSQFSLDASGDDALGSDDETGIRVFPPLAVGAGSYSLETDCFGGLQAGTPVPAFISGWIDLNRNGLFDPAERAQAACPVGSASATLTWLVDPAKVTAGTSFLRIRIARDAAQVAAPTGNALSGEVEDYPLTIAPAPATLTVGKAVSAKYLTVVSHPDLNASPPIQGLTPAQLTYTLTVHNTSAVPANNVQLTDVLPAGLTFVSSSPALTPAPTGSSLTFPLGTLTAGESRVVTVTAAPQVSPNVNQTPWLNTASAQADGSVRATSGEVRTDVIYPRLVKQVHTLAASPGADIPQPAPAWASSSGGLPGDTLEYCIDFINHSSVPLENYRVTDAIPSTTEYVTGSAVIRQGSMQTPGAPLTGVTVTVSGGTLRTSPFLLAAGERGTVCFRARIR